MVPSWLQGNLGTLYFSVATVLPDFYISLFSQGRPELATHERGAGVCAGADGPLGVPAGQHDGGGGGLGEAQPQVRPPLRQEGFRPLVR